MPSISHNADGSAIVTLSEELTIKGEKTSKVTIPAIKGKHMRLAPFKGDTTIGQLVDFAAIIIEPAGAVDEMTPSDALFCALEVQQIFTKSAK